MSTNTLRSLRRIRWAVRLTLAFGVAASVAANILHADPNPISQTIAAWPPLALLLTIELVSRVPVHRPMLAALRVLATVVISGIAAWVSYWHMQGVATRYGETDTSAYLLPVSVDGLIVVASISLIELAGRIRHAETEPATATSVGSGQTTAVIVPDRPTPEPEPAAEPAEEPRLSAELVGLARTAAAEHHRVTGQQITRDALRDRLRVSNALAGDVLRAIRTTTPTPPARLDGVPVAHTTSSN